MKQVLENMMDCTGCGTCASVCGSRAITLDWNHEGFAYPTIDPSTCTDCGMCAKTCPVAPANTGKHRHTEPPSIHAAWNLDPQIRATSSSGGVFSVLANRILDEGGIVVGAGYDADLSVRHVIVSDRQGVEQLRGSKYLQSRIGFDVFNGVKSALKNGQKVLFTGTPCQIAGIRSFIRKDSPLLITADIVCHGVPSPGLWQKYLAFKQANGSKIVANSFRDKSKGWKRSSPSIAHQYDNGKQERFAPLDNPYATAFVYDYCLREACYDCKFTSLNRTGDITLADFWGIGAFQPEYDQDDKGTSLVFLNSENGRQLIESCKDQLFFAPSTIEYALPKNPMLTHPTHRPKQRNTFFVDLNNKGLSYVIKKYRLSQNAFERKASTLVDYSKKYIKIAITYPLTFIRHRA